MGSELEARFHAAMIALYDRAKSECGYTAAYFLRMVGQHGGLQAARLLLASEDPASGFTELCLRGRLDLSVECEILRPEWRSLFTEEELAVARARLRIVGSEPQGS